MVPLLCMPSFSPWIFGQPILHRITMSSQKEMGQPDHTQWDITEPAAQFPAQARLHSFYLDVISVPYPPFSNSHMAVAGVSQKPRSSEQIIFLLKGKHSEGEVFQTLPHLRHLVPAAHTPLKKSKEYALGDNPHTISPMRK